MSKKGQRAALRLRSGENESTLDTYVTKRRRTMDGARTTEEQPEAPQVTRQQHYRIQNQWIASSLVPTSQDQRWEECGEDEVDGTILATTMPTSDRLRPVRLAASLPRGGNSKSNNGGCDSPPVESFHKFRSLDFQMRFENVFTTPLTCVRSPLPIFNWAESADVWKNMLKKDETFKRDMGLFRNHPELQPRMRSILLDWLSEVCEVYRLHKETFTLAVDYIDRYLSVTQCVPKTQLQLLGISALFIAAKLEEIYPPKLAEFAYVTDSACTEQEIIKQEMIIVKALKWDLTPMTPNSWLCVYLQVANIEHIHDPALGFVFPQFSTHAYIQIARLCDLSLMDVGSLQFRYGLIAAAALYHHTNEHVVKEVTGLNWADLYPCVRWMAPFAKAILEVGQSPMKFFPQIPNEDAHNIQTHNVDMALMDRGMAHKTAMDESEASSSSDSPLDLSSQLTCLLEPPTTESTHNPPPPDHTTNSFYRQHADAAPNSSSPLLPPQHHQHEPDLLSSELDSGDENLAPSPPPHAASGFVASPCSSNGGDEHAHHHHNINPAAATSEEEILHCDNGEMETEPHHGEMDS